MAKVLQCPQCGHRHSLDRVPDAATFACEECGRALKVPSGVRAVSPPAAPPPAVPPRAVPAQTSAPVSRPTPPAAPRPRSAAPDRPRAAPPGAAAPATGVAAAGTAASRTAPGAETPERPPRWAQALIWVAALGIGFFITYFGALQLGFLTRKQLRGVALHTDFDRYWPLLRLVPVWALLTALLVQGAAVFLARRQRGPADARPDAGAPPRATGRRPPRDASPPAATVGTGSVKGDATDDSGSDADYRPVRLGRADAPPDLPPPSRDRRPRGRTEPGR